MELEYKNLKNVFKVFICKGEEEMNSIGTKNLGEYKRDLLFYFISICNKQIALDIMDHDLYKSIPLKELNEIDNVNSIDRKSTRLNSSHT